jgi:hypothetical protein
VITDTVEHQKHRFEEQLTQKLWAPKNRQLIASSSNIQEHYNQTSILTHNIEAQFTRHAPVT